MFRSVKFDLVRENPFEELVGCPIYDAKDNRVVSNLICKISEPATSEEDNTKICRSLDVRLAEQLPRNEWNVMLTYDHPEINTEPFFISIQGDILKVLQSLMSYNVGHIKLNVKINVKLYTETEGGIQVELALSPLVEDGVYNHSCYIYNTQCTTGISSTERVNVSNFGSISIWIEGLSPDSRKILHNPCAKNVWKFRHEMDVGSDLVLLYKIGNDDENDKPIRANENILCAQSPVIMAMLKEGNFKEGATREIPMTDRTKREVIAFLDYLCYGLGEETLEDSVLSSVLYEMAHYYNVKDMEQSMKYFFIGQAHEYFEAEAALRLFKVANGVGDNGMKQLAVDVLKLRDETLNFGSISEMFKTDRNGMSELFRMYGKF